MPLESACSNSIAAVPSKTDESIQASLQFMISQSRDLVLSQYRDRTDPLRKALRAYGDLLKSQDYRRYFERNQMESSLRS